MKGPGLVIWLCDTLISYLPNWIWIVSSIVGVTQLEAYKYKLVIRFLSFGSTLLILMCLLWPNLYFLELTSCLEKIFHQDLYASYFHLCLSIYMTVKWIWIFNRLEHKTKCYKNTTDGTGMEIIFNTWKIHSVALLRNVYFDCEVSWFHSTRRC